MRTAPAGRRTFRAHWPKMKWPRALQSIGATWKALRLPLTEGMRTTSVPNDRS